MNIRPIIGPLFWIASTYVAITYGPDIIQKKTGKTINLRPPISQSSTSANNTLGAETEISSKETSGTANPTKISIKSPEQIPQLIKEIIENTKNQIIERGNQQVVETKTQVTANVCAQVMAELAKQCSTGVTGTSTIRPTETP